MIIMPEHISTEGADFVTITGQGHYYFDVDKYSWQSVRDICMSLGMDLIAVESEVVNLLVDSKSLTTSSRLLSICNVSIVPNP